MLKTANMKVSIPAMTYSKTSTRWILITFTALLLPLRTFAALGDISQSVVADQAQMKASIRIIQADAYTIHEMKSPLGTVVREYVAQSDGRVFGITWQEPFVPDLKQLLGNYFQQYSVAAKVQRESHVGTRPLNIQEPGLVVQTAGHMRAFSGRAYDPRLLPSGVNANDIR